MVYPGCGVFIMGNYLWKHVGTSIWLWKISNEKQFIKRTLNIFQIQLFLGYHLVAFIRSWQNALNEVATKNDISIFRFNTYTIAVLVIFFLQMSQTSLETIDLSVLRSKITTDNSNDIKNRNDVLMEAVNSFFEFYTKKYDFNCQLAFLMIFLTSLFINNIQISLCNF